MTDKTEIKTEVVVGNLTVREEYSVTRSGETASTYSVTHVLRGVYPVVAESGYAGLVLVARIPAWLVETFHVNRVFSSSEVQHVYYEVGEKAVTHQWRWGDHASDRYSPPPTQLTVAPCWLRMAEGWIITAEYRGNYTDGGPMIHYSVVKKV